MPQSAALERFDRDALDLQETCRLRALTALNILDTLPEERFDTITRLACRIFKVPISFITLIDRKRVWAKSGIGMEFTEGPRSLSFCTHAIKTPETMVVEDALLDPRFVNNPYVVGPPHLRFYAGRPIHGSDYERVGALCVVDNKPRKFSADDLASLNDLGAMVDRKLFLITNATTDMLTGLANRQGFMDVASTVLRICQRGNTPATLITFDLDKFKTVNDTAGHKEGDRVLQLFAKLLHSHFRKSDIIARFGGDEFAVLCGPSADFEVDQSLERLRLQFIHSPLVKKYPRLGWTAGIAQYVPEAGQTIEELLEESDSRMYRGKRT